MSAQLVLRLLIAGEVFLGEVLGGEGDGGRFCAGLGHLRERSLLMVGITLDGVHEVGNEVGATLILALNLAPLLAYCLIGVDHAVVA